MTQLPPTSADGDALEKRRAAAASSNGWSWAMGGALVAGLVVGITMWTVNVKQRDIYLDALTKQNKRNEGINAANQFARVAQEQQIKLYEAVLGALQSKGAALYEVSGTAKQPEARGRVVFDSGANKYFLLTTGLKPLAEGKVYELWLSDEKGAVGAGIFTVGENGSAILAATPERAVVPTAFEVSEENVPGGKTREGEVQLMGAAKPKL